MRLLAKQLPDWELTDEPFTQKDGKVMVVTTLSEAVVDDTPLNRASTSVNIDLTLRFVSDTVRETDAVVDECRYTLEALLESALYQGFDSVPVESDLLQTSISFTVRR